jgi:hypothetical protein
MTGVQLTKRGFLVTIFLYFTFFTWYYIFSLLVLRQVFGSSAETYLVVNGSFNFIIAIVLLLNSFFIHRFSKTRIIYGCSLATSIVTILLLFTSSMVIRLIIVFVAGTFFCIGQLAALTFFWTLTVSKERGRVAGLTGFFALPIFHILSLIAGTFDFYGVIMLSVILSLGPLAIKLLGPEKKARLTTKKDKEGYHPEKRTVLLYTIPWLLFSLINATLARNVSFYISQYVPSSYYFMVLSVSQLAGYVFGALSGGMISDFFGRRLTLIFSLTLYGISSALVGFVENYAIFGFVYVANGVNWGILWVLYGSVVWGDLANEETCAKRYSIGLLVFYLATGVGSLLTNQVSQIPLIVSSLVSCLLIFLSNIPLILAPELLSSDFREKIKLKLYMNVVRKLRKQSQDQG